jgi:two-component system NarL family response regulator
LELRRNAHVGPNDAAIGVAVLSATPELRGELERAIAYQLDLRVVGPDDAKQADVVIIEADSPGSGAHDWLHRCAELKAADANRAVIVLDDEPDDAALRCAIRAGANGYLTRCDDLAILPTVVRTVRAGSGWLSSELLLELVSEARPDRRSGRPARVPPSNLSHRERSVLRLLADGSTQTDIANRLFISPHTVRTHVRNLVRKLGAHSRVEAVAVALDAGLIDLDS